MSRRSALPIAVLGFLALSFQAADGEREALAGSADRKTSASDPEDVEGRLDLVYERHTSLGRRMTLLLRTADPWANTYLADPQDGRKRTAYLFWEFDSNGDASFDCSGRFFANPRGDIKFQRSGPRGGKIYGTSRRTRRSVSVTVPLHFCGLQAGGGLRSQSAVNGLSGSDIAVEQVDVAPTLVP